MARSGAIGCDRLACRARTASRVARPMCRRASFPRLDVCGEPGTVVSVPLRRGALASDPSWLTRTDTTIDSRHRIRGAAGYFMLASRSASSSQVLIARMMSSLAGIPFGNSCWRSASRSTEPSRLVRARAEVVAARVGRRRRVLVLAAADVARAVVRRVLRRLARD